MPGPKPVAITLTLVLQQLLETLTRRSTAAQALVQRAKIILAAHQGLSTSAISRHGLGSRECVQRWRQRWADAAPRLTELQAHGASEQDLADSIEAVLHDAPRPGAPPTFTATQVAQIQALACEDPRATDQPFSTWTDEALAQEAVTRGLVPQISPRTIGRFLKAGGITPASSALLADASRR